MNDVRKVSFIDQSLIHAAKSNNIRSMLHQCLCGANLLCCKDENDDSLLVVAIKTADLYQVVEFLLLYGIDVNEVNQYGHTALTLAIFFYRPKIVDVLIERGADLNAVSYMGCSPLIFAAYGLASYSRPFFTAEIMQKLLDKGAYACRMDNYGNTSLVIVLSSLVECFKKLPAGKILNVETLAAAIVQKLLYKGVDANKPDNLGNTPLILAAMSGSVKCVEILLKFGVDMKCINKLGFDAFAIAQENGYTHITKMLLSKEQPFPYLMAGYVNELNLSSVNVVSQNIYNTGSTINTLSLSKSELPSTSIYITDVSYCFVYAPFVPLDKTHL